MAKKDEIIIDCPHCHNKITLESCGGAFESNFMWQGFCDCGKVWTLEDVQE